MIEIQLRVDGPWVPLLRAMTGFDLTISEGERMLRAGLAGVRVLFPTGGVSMTVRRYGAKGKYGFLWQSASMAAPAFANFDPPE